MISAYGQPSALSLVLSPADERTGGTSYGRSNSSSNTNSSISSSTRAGSSSTQTIVDIQVSPCGLFIAVLSPWGVLLYSNGQCRMVLGRCLVPRDSEVYGRLRCCCWASDSSTLFVSADPLACVCVFSIESTSTRSSRLLEHQRQDLQHQSAETGEWSTFSAAEGHEEASTAGAAAAATAVPLAAGRESWLMEGFSTAVDTRLLGSTGSVSEGDGHGSEAEEEQLQPAAAENASTAEEAIRSLPSMVTAYRPPNTSPLSVSFCLLLRLPVRPSALCCSSVQRQQLLLVGCSRQPAVFWLQLGGLTQVLGCLYTSDLLRVAKTAGVCPGNAGPPYAAVAVPGVASATATRATWSRATNQNKTPAAADGWGCPCSACGGRCCCFLKRPSPRHTRRSSSSNSAPVLAEAGAEAGATVPSSRRCRCLGRRRPITYLFHPKGYAAVTELLQLPASAQDARLLPDLPDAFFCGGFDQSSGCTLSASLRSKSAPTNRRCSRTTRAPQLLRTTYCNYSAECSSHQPTLEDGAMADFFHCFTHNINDYQPRSSSQLQLQGHALPSSDSKCVASVSSISRSITTNCNSTNTLAVGGAGACRSSRTTTVWDTRTDPRSLAASSGGVMEGADSGLLDGATVAVAGASGNFSSSSGGTSDDGMSLMWSNRRPTRRPCSAWRLELPEQTRKGGPREMHCLTDDALSDYAALRARCCGGVRQLQLNRRLDLLAVVTAVGELLLLAWRFPLRGYSEVDDLKGFENRAKGAGTPPQSPRGRLASQQHFQQLKPEVPLSGVVNSGIDTGKEPNPVIRDGQLRGGRSISNEAHSHCRGCGSICIGAGLDGRVAIGHSAREGFVGARSASEAAHSNINTNMLRPWRPLGLQLRAEAVCCCAMNGERSLVAVGLGSGFVELYRLIWPRNAVEQVRNSRKPQQQPTQHRQTSGTHRNVERDGFTLFPQLLHVIPVPDDIKAAAELQVRTGVAHTPKGTASKTGPSYLQSQSVQSLEWTADGAALAVRWLRGGTAVFSHTGGMLFSIPDPSAAEPRLRHQQHFDAGVASADAAATAAALAAGATAGSGQLCSWIMGSFSLLHVCPSRGANAKLGPDGHGTSLFDDVDHKREGPTSEQLLEVSVVRSASVAAAGSSVDVCGSRCGSDLTDRVMIGGSHLLVWSFLGNTRASASLSIVPLPPSVYTAKAFPLKQAALSPDGTQMLVAGSRGFALFALLQRRWRLLCLERQEAQLPTGTLPLGWYTKDIFFVSTPAYNPSDDSASSAAAAAAPEQLSTLNAPDAAPRWLLPSSVFRRFEAAVAAAVDLCPSRFAAHVPLTIHEKTAWLQQQQQQCRQFASRLWGAAGHKSGSREISAIATAAVPRGTSSSSSTMWHYAMVFLSSSERLDLRCRVAEIKRLPARPHTATVLPSLQQQQLLRPAASLGAHCCLCCRESNRNGSICMLCSGLAAFRLRSVGAGNTAAPLLAVYDALGVLTTYQLQLPQSQKQRQPRQHDVVTLWQLDLSDFCDRPPQQIRFVGCAWLLLVLLQSGTLLLLRVSTPRSGHLVHHGMHRIPRLIVDTFTVVAKGVTGVWVGAEAQLQQHYVLPSSRLCVLRPQQRHHRQEDQELADEGGGESAACCCICSAQVTVPPRQSDRGKENQQEVLHQNKSASDGLCMLQEAALKQSNVNNFDPGCLQNLSDDKLNTCSIGGSNKSSRAAEAADAEQGRANSALPWPQTTCKTQGSSAAAVHRATHSGSSRSNLSSESAEGSRSPGVGSSRPRSRAAAPLSPLPFQRIVDFPRPAAVVPVLSECRNNNLYDQQLEHQQQEAPPKHLVRKGYAPLSLPVLAAEISHRAGGGSQQTCKVSGSKPDDAGGLQANGTPEQQIRRRFQTFWAAGRKQLLNDNQKAPKKDISLEAYARGSSPVLLHSTHSEASAGVTAGGEKRERTRVTPAASGGFAGATVRAEQAVVDSECCGGSGLDSSPTVRSSVVAAQPWEARIESCDVCCCCIAGWHIWAQTPAGLLLTSVGFHYSGTAAAAAEADLTPEQLLEATDVRVRSALVLPVEARPQPLHIVGIIGELGVAVAGTPSRETALGFPIQIQPATQIRLLLQPCTHALLQRQLLAAVARIPVHPRAPFLLFKGRRFGAAAEGHMRDLIRCTGNVNSTNGNQDTCRSCKRLFVSVCALVRESLASVFAHHLLELSQFGLLMRCISTYLKAAKSQRLAIQPCRNREQPLFHSTTAIGVPCVKSTQRGALEDVVGSVRIAAAGALARSSEGAALQWLLRLLQRASPPLFVATLVSCMRKTEPLVSPAVLGSLLQQQVPPADPITLFTACLESGLLQTASLYLLPIQTAEGPLQVRCRRVLPLLRAALAAGDFLLVRKLLHFFWAFFKRKHHPVSASKRSKVEQQQPSAESAAEAHVGCAVQWLWQGQPTQTQRKFQHKRGTRISRQLADMRSLLWRPLRAEGLLNFPDTECATDAGADGSFCSNTWFPPVPLELPRAERLLAARVYEEVETAVAVAATALLQQQKWLQLFDFATTLALDLPAWLRGHGNGDLLKDLDQPHMRSNQQESLGTDGLTISSSALTVPEGAGPSSTAATGGATPTAAQIFHPLFSEAVSSFTEQLCIGDMPVPLRLKRPFLLPRSSLDAERKHKQLSLVWKDELQVEGRAAAVLRTACRQSRICTASLVPPLCSNGDRQQQATAEIARYLANVLLLSGHPGYTLALAAAVRDRDAAKQILSWYPQLRSSFPPAVVAAWVDKAEGQVALERSNAVKES
ncbi:hypothetical protein, conserved [Eimeria brunetti]|uniref:RIC1 C-terminal alpha solenoid region domain-containing protein n=1 Tax=Eimeria brunetti TaxID=51314 RepID=U6LPY9_9EIME|nr:hypothetical protein, conserved [Eimeria brunetti]